MCIRLFCSLAFALWSYKRIKRLLEDLGNEQHFACCDDDWFLGFLAYLAYDTWLDVKKSSWVKVV